MGTRSTTHFMSEWTDGQEICRVYRQMDGYPEGQGYDLAVACNRVLTNGISGYGSDKPYTTANGMGELAAQVIRDLKTAQPMGGIYIEAPSGFNDSVDYFYIVTGKEGELPRIECRAFRWTGLEGGPESLAAAKLHSELVFEGDPKQWIRKYKAKAPSAAKARDLAALPPAKTAKVLP